MVEISDALAIAAANFPKGPEAVAARMGIKVRHSPIVGCDGWCLQANTIAVIRINCNKPEARQRFTLAHELAHLLLGSKPEIGSEADLFDSNDEEEKAANQLAAELLLPRQQITQLVPKLPVESASIRELARRSGVSQLMAACRISDVAKEIGLINAAVISFEGAAVKWIWSKTLNVPHNVACDLFAKTKGANRGVYRGVYAEGQAIVASIIGSSGASHLFIQFLPTEIAGQKNATEILAEHEAWLFEDDASFRGAVNGCLSSFKKQAELLKIDDALAQFNRKYLTKWDGANGSRIREKRGQEFLRFRLMKWCK